ncbi:MAG: S41 family peptidase, partial [Muribaculaceae bacterium]|nr:S41 family peptidase [Muribaculaceae bacterium]
GCGDVPAMENNPRGNFEALWTILDEHYCFFEEKGIDWDEVYAMYSPRVDNEMTSDELFVVLSDMIDELKDGHTNLSSGFQTSYYRKWWSDYPQNYNERIIQQFYFNYNYRSIGGIDYGFLSDNIGYMRYSSFANAIGEGNLDYVLQFLATARGLIIDVRDNGGGSLTNVETLVARFITEPTLVGYISHKTGPGHNDFSEPRPFTYNPIGVNHLRYGKPVVVLCNRSTFSAANNFVAIMKNIPGVTIVGARSGGGGGMPYTSELPNGWGIRFSACAISDANGNATEDGIEPSPGCEVDMDPVLEAQGIDTILERAIEVLSGKS